MVSIRTKITLVLVSLLLFSLTLEGILVSVKFERAVTDQLNANLLLIAREKAKEYGMSFTRIQDEVNNIVQSVAGIYLRSKPIDLALGDNILMPWNGTIYGDNESEARLKNEKQILYTAIPVLQGIVANDPLATSGYMGTETSMFACDSADCISQLAKLNGYDNTKRPWYKLATDAGKLVWTKPYIDAITKKLCVSAVMPVYLPDESLIGVAGIDVLLDTILADVLQLDIGYQGYAFLIDNDGNILVAPEMTASTNWKDTFKSQNLLESQNPELTAIANKMVSGSTGLGSLQSKSGEEIVAFTPIPSIGASLGIVIPLNEAMKPVTRTRYMVLAIVAIVSLLAIVIGFCFSNTIIKPIERLTAIADAISLGKMNLETMPENRKDEIGKLIQSINRLITSLKLAISYRKKQK